MQLLENTYLIDQATLLFKTALDELSPNSLQENDLSNRLCSVLRDNLLKEGQDPTSSLCSKLKDRVLKESEVHFSSHIVLRVLDFFGLLEKFFLDPAIDKCLENCRNAIHSTLINENLTPPKWLYVTNQINLIKKQKLYFTLNKEVENLPERVETAKTVLDADADLMNRIEKETIAKYLQNRESDLPPPSADELPPIPYISFERNQLLDLFSRGNPDLDLPAIIKKTKH